MTTSGTQTWNLDVAQIIETAARRARPANAGLFSAKEARDARNCLNLTLTDLTNRGHSLSTLEYKTLNLVANTQSYTLASDVIDVYDVVYRKYDSVDASFKDYSMTREDISTYNQINDKTTTGHISKYSLVRGNSTVTMFIYPVADNADDKIGFWALTRPDDVTAANQNADMPYRYNNVLITGTAWYMAQERDDVMAEKINMLEARYEKAIALAFEEDRDRSSLFLVPGGLR